MKYCIKMTTPVYNRSNTWVDVLLHTGVDFILLPTGVDVIILHYTV
jgi:hypothetical protein